MTPLATAHLRVARPTDDLAPLIRFYHDALGMTVLGSFEDHEGFDGVMLGFPGAAWHLEFTKRNGHSAGRSPSDEHLIVFYLPDTTEWQRAISRLTSLGHEPVVSANPYWDRHGRTFVDPDGYRVVLENAGWQGA
jgi:catechol 2,3-dioxygenase-like lactoylglutathione lyase family enzyme